MSVLKVLIVHKLSPTVVAYKLRNSIHLSGLGLSDRLYLGQDCVCSQASSLCFSSLIIDDFLKTAPRCDISMYTEVFLRSQTNVTTPQPMLPPPTHHTYKSTAHDNVKPFV